MGLLYQRHPPPFVKGCKNILRLIVAGDLGFNTILRVHKEFESRVSSLPHTYVDRPDLRIGAMGWPVGVRGHVLWFYRHILRFSSCMTDTMNIYLGIPVASHLGFTATYLGVGAKDRMRSIWEN